MSQLSQKAINEMSVAAIQIKGKREREYELIDKNDYYELQAYGKTLDVSNNPAAIQVAYHKSHANHKIMYHVVAGRKICVMEKFR